MSETKFKPWTLYGSGGLNLDDGHGNLLAYITDGTVNEGSPDQWVCDLIAAAPDLYEALGDLLHLFDEVAPGYSQSTIAFAARAALAKAHPILSPQAEAETVSSREDKQP